MGQGDEALPRLASALLAYLLLALITLGLTSSAFGSFSVRTPSSNSAS